MSCEEGSAGEGGGTKFQGSRLERFQRAAAGPGLRTHARRERPFHFSRPRGDSEEQFLQETVAARLYNRCSPVRLQRTRRGRSRTYTHDHAGGEDASLEEFASVWQKRNEKTHAGKRIPQLVHGSCVPVKR